MTSTGSVLTLFPLDVTVQKILISPLQSPSFVVVVDKVIWCSPAAPAQSLRHLCESFCFNEVVEGEWREHCSVAMDFGLDEQGSSTDAIEVDEGLRVS